MVVADLVRTLLAGGVFAAVVPTGLWLLRCFDERSLAPSCLLSWTLAIPLGIAFWSLPLVGAALLGRFDPAIIGTAGWVSALVLAQQIGCRLPPLATSWHGVGATIGLMVLAWLYAAFPNESLLGSRDEGLYSLMALLLLRTGGLVLEAPMAAATAPGLFQPFNYGQPASFFLPGVYQAADGPMLQFPPLLPVWAAQLAAASFGRGLFSCSAIFSLSAVVVFHALARRLLRQPMALLATVIVALNPATIWIARLNLVEPLARLVVLGGLLAAVVAFERRSARLAVVAGALFGCSAFGRLDLLLLSPLMVIALVVVGTWPAPRLIDSRRTMATLAGSTIAAQALAVVLLWFVSPVYVRVNANVVYATAVAAVIAMVFMAAAGARPFAHLQSMQARRVIGIGLATAIFLALAYAALIRPEIGPFALIHRPGHVLDGARDFRERSLLSLAAYISWPVIIAAAVGAVIAVRRLTGGRAHAALAVVAIVFVSSSLVMLSNPRISPDHYWAVRRFVPLVIPGFALLAGYGLQALLVRVRGVSLRLTVSALAAAVGAWLVIAQWPTLFVRENHDLAEQVHALDSSLGDASLVVVRELDALAATLFVGYSRPVLPLRDGAVAVDASARAFWSHCTVASPCQLVHLDHRGLAGLALGASRRMVLEHRHITPTPVPLPSGTTSVRSEFFITPVHGLASDPASALVGAYRDWNVDDQGFYLEDLLPTASGRWTNGDATIRLPAGVDADTLELRLVVPGKAPGPIRIGLDGIVLHDGPLDGYRRLEFALGPREPAGASRELRITSATFNPKASGDSTDGRDLGVWIAAVRQYDSSAPRLDRSSDNAALRGRVTVVGGPYAPAVSVGAKRTPVRVAMTVVNDGPAVWPGGDEVGEGEVAVELGLKWRRRGGSAVLFQQRVGLPFALRPRERILLAPELGPPGSEFMRVQPGDYEVEVDLVQDGVTWFAARGAVPARLSVRVVGEADAER